MMQSVDDTLTHFR